MHTPFPDSSFDTIVCCSVIEHQVNYEAFAKEVSRLLRTNGTLIVSFDYWNPKPDTSKSKLYSLDWNILDLSDVFSLIEVLKENNVLMSGDMDTTTQDAVINPSYCSPAAVEYTFGIFKFYKA
jgi:SAM-dependent methyltransferase